MIAQLGTAKINHESIVTWEPLPKDFQLEDNPVENDGQPLLAGVIKRADLYTTKTDRCKLG